MAQLTLPHSFQAEGFITAQQLIAPISGRKTLGIMISSEGDRNSGKTEFALSIPGWGQGLLIDRGASGLLRNSAPPTARNPNWGFKVIQCPPYLGVAGAAEQEAFKQYWRQIRESTYTLCANPDSTAGLVDGDSDSWEIQRLGDFGKLTQVPPHMYTTTNAARRAYYTRLKDCGKVIVCTNKVKKEYIDKLDQYGRPEIDSSGANKRVWSGRYEKQGFNDGGFVFEVRLNHFFIDAEIGPDGGIVKPGEFAVEIMDCKANRRLQGDVLSGDDCNFRGLMQHVYPQIPLHMWGFAK